MKGELWYLIMQIAFVMMIVLVVSGFSNKAIAGVLGSNAKKQMIDSFEDFSYTLQDLIMSDGDVVITSHVFTMGPKTYVIAFDSGYDAPRDIWWYVHWNEEGHESEFVEKPNACSEGVFDNVPTDPCICLYEWNYKDAKANYRKYENREPLQCVKLTSKQKKDSKQYKPVIFSSTYSSPYVTREHLAENPIEQLRINAEKPFIGRLREHQEELPYLLGSDNEVRGYAYTFFVTDYVECSDTLVQINGYDAQPFGDGVEKFLIEEYHRGKWQTYSMYLEKVETDDAIYIYITTEHEGENLEKRERAIRNAHGVCSDKSTMSCKEKALEEFIGVEGNDVVPTYETSWYILDAAGYRENTEDDVCYGAFICEDIPSEFGCAPVCVPYCVGDLCSGDDCAERPITEPCFCEGAVRTEGYCSCTLTDEGTCEHGTFNYDDQVIEAYDGTSWQTYHYDSTIACSDFHFLLDELPALSDTERSLCISSKAPVCSVTEGGVPSCVPRT